LLSEKLSDQIQTENVRGHK